ncbi:nuclear receptor-binding factor 2 [Ostrinia nubilalis]
MESHPLNLAHQQHRRAEAHIINYRYDEAMQCHHNAAELLLDAMKSTTSSGALESITLQHSYHLKQKDLIKSKKEQYARVKKALENIKNLGKDPFYNLQANDNAKVQVAIYRTINETDSLLQMLSTKKANEPVAKDTAIKDVVDGRKKEKTPQTVVEELQTLSQNLHSLVEQLVLQVEVLKDENTTLKEKVNYLEKERTRYLNLPSSYEISHRNSVNTTGDGYSVDLAQKLPVITEMSKPISNRPTQ